jgi:hypothetical protein
VVIVSKPGKVSQGFLMGKKNEERLPVSKVTDLYLHLNRILVVVDRNEKQRFATE